MPRISIIINNYNYGRYLAEAIESALQQSYVDTEVIVVDDGSSDDSWDIISSYGERIIAVKKPNGGQASTFNVGLMHASGAIILFLDSDDRLYPEAAGRLAEAWRQNPGLARIHYRMEVIDKQSMPTGVIKPPLHIPLPSGDLSQHVLSFPDDMSWLPTSGNAYSAAVLRRIFPIPESSFRILADSYLTHITPLFGPVVAIEDVCASYRIHGANNHEQGSLDLVQVRRSLTHWRNSHSVIKHFASELDLTPRPMGAVTYAANRLISLKLESAQHPFANDSRWRILFEGCAAALRRFDVAWPMRGLFILWLISMALAPKKLARWLAQQWLFSENRPAVNRLLNLFHRAGKKHAPSPAPDQATPTPLSPPSIADGH